MRLIIGLAIWVFLAWACAMLASRKGYGRTLASVLGLLFGFFALIGYAVVPRKNSSAA